MTRRGVTAKQVGNAFYQFSLGSIVVLSGKKEFIEQCLSQLPGWEAAGTADATDAKSVGKGMAPSDQALWKQILGYLGVAINVVCLAKDNIIKLFTENRRRLMRRNRRLFLQGKRMKRFNWSLSGAWNSFKSTAAKVYDKAVKVVKGTVNLVVDGVNYATKKSF